MPGCIHKFLLHHVVAQEVLCTSPFYNSFYCWFQIPKSNFLKKITFKSWWFERKCRFLNVLVFPSTLCRLVEEQIKLLFVFKIPSFSCHLIKLNTRTVLISWIHCWYIRSAWAGVFQVGVKIIFWAWGSQGEGPRRDQTSELFFHQVAQYYFILPAFCCWYPLAVVNSSQSCLVQHVTKASLHQSSILSLAPLVYWNGRTCTRTASSRSVWASSICRVRSQKALLLQWNGLVLNCVLLLLEKSLSGWSLVSF